MRAAVVLVILLAGCATTNVPTPTPSTPGSPTPATVSTSPETSGAPTEPTPTPLDERVRLVGIGNSTFSIFGADAILARPGRVTILGDLNATPGLVRAMIEAQGGEFLPDRSTSRVFEASLPEARVTSALAAFEAEPFVLVAFPTFLLDETSSLESLPTPVATTAPVVLLDHDVAPSASCGGATHGQITRSLAGNDTDLLDLKANDVGVASAIERVVMGTDEPRVISISLGAFDGLPGRVDRHACDAPECLQARAAQAAFLWTIYHTLAELPTKDRERALVTVSSGNSGLNMTYATGLLRRLYPEVADQIVIVGGTDAAGAPSAVFSSSDTPEDMVFAQGRDVPTSVGGIACSVNGTSFAAPQVARLAGELHAKFPALNMSQIGHVIRSASTLENGTAPMKKGFYRMPTLERASVVVDILYGKPKPVTPTPTAAPVPSPTPTPPTPTPSPTPPPAPTYNVTSRFTASCTLFSTKFQDPASYGSYARDYYTYRVSAAGTMQGPPRAHVLVRLSYDQYSSTNEAQAGMNGTWSQPDRYDTAWTRSTSNAETGSWDADWRVERWASHGASTTPPVVTLQASISIPYDATYQRGFFAEAPTLTATCS